MAGIKRFLIIILGPTASGKTALTIKLAKEFGTIVISADSRQFYREMQIGTSRPSLDEMEGVMHYFSGQLSVGDYYSAGKFELDVLTFLEDRFKRGKIVFMTGGSGLYIDAVCSGIDDSPPLDQAIRNELISLLKSGGEEELLRRLRSADPVYYDLVDKMNPKRIIRALEVIEQTGKPYSELRKNVSKKRPFEIFKIGIELPRDELYTRIDSRVDRMIEAGLLEEARKLYQYRASRALKTVGYDELFSFFEGNSSLEDSIKLIKKNTRKYAKRQLTWFKRDKSIRWFNAAQIDEIMTYIKSHTG